MLFPEECKLEDFGFVPESRDNLIIDPAILRVSDVISATAAEFGVLPSDIRCHRRSQKLVSPRQAAMWIAREHTRMAFPALGRIFRKDHTTVMYGAAKAEERMRDDPIYRGRVIRVLWRLEKDFAADFS